MYLRLTAILATGLEESVVHTGALTDPVEVISSVFEPELMSAPASSAQTGDFPQRHLRTKLRAERHDFFAPAVTKQTLVTGPS